MHIRCIFSNLPNHFLFFYPKGYNFSQVTCGGVDTREVNESTMESRLVDGLYFCGEILDVDGRCGGYNLHWAFASGLTAGELK